MLVYLVLLILALFIGAMMERESNRSMCSTGVSAVTFIVVCLVLISPIYYEFPGSYTVVSFRNGKAITHPFGMFVWETGRYVNMPTTPLFLDSAVNIVTDNPKVRKVSYSVSAQITSPEKFYSETSGRKTLGACFGSVVTRMKVQEVSTSHRCAETEIQRQVAYQLYRFNADKSKELALLDNPLDGSQVEEMKRLVEGYLNPRLEVEGITATFYHFSVD